jgi:PAS domain S-box-containing protein
VFRLLPRINIAGQLTLLVAVVAGLAIYVVSRAAEQHGRDLLLVRGQANLADECRVEGLALREAVRNLGRTFNGRVEELTRLSADVAAQDRVLEMLFAPPIDSKAGDPSAIREACLLVLSPEGEVRNRTVYRLGARVEVPPEIATSRASGDLWGQLRKANPLDTATLFSRFHRDGTPGAYRYLLAVGCRGEARLEGRLALQVTLDFTRLVENHARRLPRNLLFVRDEEGVCLYHPDPKQVGSTSLPWNLVADAGPHGTLRDAPVDGLAYWTERAKIDSPKADSPDDCARLERELSRWPELRFSHIREGDTSIILSCADEKILDEANKAVGAGDASARRTYCARFIGTRLPRWPLDAGRPPGKPLEVDIILSAALEELTAQESRASSEFWLYRSLPAVVASAVLALIAAHFLTRPLRRLKLAADQLAKGNYAIDVSVVGPGEVGDLANTFRDMTEQIRRRERDLREKLAWMDTILANAADGIMTFDQTGRIEQANRAAEEMFGYTHGKLEGEKVKQLMPISERINKPVAMALEGDNYGGTVARLWSAVKTPGEEHRGRRKDGTSFWMEVTFSRVPLEDRSIVTAIFRDITRRKLDEERIRKLNDDLEARVKLRTAQLEDTKTKLELALAEAENASAAKDRFISVVSHELRTPLTSAMGYTELLLNPRAERLRQAPMPTLHKILTSCKHLLTLINDLLDIGRYTAGKPIDLALSRFDLAGFLRGAVEMIAPLVKRNDNALESRFPDDLGEVVNDETRLRQILLNLLSNASKFTEKGKVILEVERKTTAEGERVVLRVRDTGAGMTREQLDKLFTPFYRVDNSATRKQGGTGLGLTITRMLAELMGGTIEVDSTPGVGSTFTVDLPVEARPIPAKPAGRDDRKGRPALAAGGVVLVIDDDASVRQILHDYLTAEGYQVEQADSGPGGVERARELQPVCITLDVLMPGQDGWTTLAQLKSDPITQDIPVIMLTILEDRNLGFTVGATEYITKPIDWARLGTLLCQYAPGPAPILLVEDDAVQRDYMREELMLAGWKVSEASNGIEALQKCESAMPGLILLDLMMPVMDGFAFLEELRHRPGGGSVPVLVVTARDLSDEERRRLNRSLAQVLARDSLTREQLLDRIREQIK